MMNTYELHPVDGRKSFYGKAIVKVDIGEAVLFSYGTKICTKTANGEIIRHWGGWSQTTGRHIKAFCGLNKAEFEALPLEETPTSPGGRTLTNAESYAAMMSRRCANG